MVSLWPWSGDANSPASFEKTLSTLSVKITDSQSRLDKTRTSSRRFKVLWTLYLTFAYLLYSILLLVVVGYQNLGPFEWSGIGAGPVIIYVVRKTMSAIYAFRIDTLETRLKTQQEERAKTIQKLKEATKYDSTMELIEKYGGEKKKKKEDEEAQAKAKQQSKQGQQQPLPGRLNLPPPPTANIQRPQQPSEQQQPAKQNPLSTNSLEPTEEFAPNAFSHSGPPPPPPGTAAYGPVPESHWYDRIFDVLLGEDEAAPKNRIVLICQSCRLVNGQAPPGTTTLASLGTWRCMACHTVNGEEDESKRIIDEVLAETVDNEEVDDAEESGEEDVSGVMVEVDETEGTTGIDSQKGSKGKVRKR